MPSTYAKTLQDHYVHFDKYTCVTMLKACARLKYVEINAKINKIGLERDLCSLYLCVQVVALSQRHRKHLTSY